MKFFLGAALAAVALVSGSTPDTPRCHGRQPGIVGTDGPDVLYGTSHRDVIWAGAGDDVVYGSLGNDLICGGPGADLLHGGRGNDLVDGGAGDDDIVLGDLGDDHLLGGPGNADEVGGGLGIDVLNGGPGSDDLVHGDYGFDRMDGGSGGGDIASFATDIASAKGAGVRASLAAHRARGDGHDRLFRFESLEGTAFPDVLIGDRRDNVIEGGPGNDHLFGGRGSDTLDGGQGKDGCKGGPTHLSCGRERPLKSSAYVALDPTLGGGAGLVIVGGPGRDDITVTFEDSSATYAITAARGIALSPGCARPTPPPGSPANIKQANCPADGPARWLTADLGRGDDHLRVDGSLAAVESVRLAGGPGNDVIHAGPEDDLVEAGTGSDRLYGGAGSDGLIGGLPGPTFLYGGGNGDLLAAGGGCAGGALVGGPGRDDASFAETQAHPGTLYISLAQGIAYIDAVRGCHKVHLARSDEDIEGSFDNDVLIGDAGANSMLGQPGVDRFYGRGGNDVIDARDGVHDDLIQCGRHRPSGRALTDPFDPPPIDCAARKHGHPVPGLNGG